MRYALYLLVGCALLIVVVVLFRWPTHPGASRAADIDYPAMQFELPPITNPELIPADEADLADDEMVIGVVVDGEPRAYVCDAFGKDPGQHVVHDSIRSRSLAVTYCDRQLCARVLTAKNISDELDVSIGGWRPDQTMDLIVNDKRYSQKSTDIPLADWPFVQVAWGQWRHKHPDTLVYVGNAAAKTWEAVN